MKKFMSKITFITFVLISCIIGGFISEALGIKDELSRALFIGSGMLVGIYLNNYVRKDK